jgi:hypothetical protein
MNKKEKQDQRNEEVISSLLETLNSHKVTHGNIHIIMSGFLYSVGYSLLDNPPKNNDEVLLRYAESPTLGSALMAQAVFMKETWSQKEEKKDDKRIQGKTKRRKVATTL